MPVATPAPIYETNDIIHGHGEVPAGQDHIGLYWFLPGGEITRERDVAEHHAKRLDRMIQVNMKRYDRSLIW